MISDRQKLILKAIVEEYVSSIEPVGSKVLTEKPYLDFSSATIRFDMAHLEELGFIEKTHTSSGRIPSELGYKYYVNHLLTLDHDILDTFPLIDEIFAKDDLSKDEAINEAINLLSNLTNYATIALGPNQEKSRVKRIDFVPLTRNEALILIITNLGFIHNQKIKIQDEKHMEHMQKIILTLDEVLHDKTLNEVLEILKMEFAKFQIKEFMNYQDQIINGFISAFQKIPKENFYLSGMTKVFTLPEFNDPNKIRNFMNVMEKRHIFRIINDEVNGLTIKIGKENKITSMDNYSVISIPYVIDDDENGTIAVIGPTRMEYKKVIPLVEYIAHNMSKLYKK